MNTSYGNKTDTKNLSKPIVSKFGQDTYPTYK